jgi:hypothetical protein
MRKLFAVSIAAAVLLATSAIAQTPASVPTVINVPANTPPPLPGWLKVTCMQGPDKLELSPNCSVVKYKGFTTWAYSFRDNRESFSFVVYDDQNEIVSIATKDGARYVWKITVNPANKTVTVWGQANQFVNVQWFEVSRGIE